MAALSSIDSSLGFPFMLDPDDFSASSAIPLGGNAEPRRSVGRPYACRSRATSPASQPTGSRAASFPCEVPTSCRDVLGDRRPCSRQARAEEIPRMPVRAARRTCRRPPPRTHARRRARHLQARPRSPARHSWPASRRSMSAGSRESPSRASHIGGKAPSTSERTDGFVDRLT